MQVQYTDRAGKIGMVNGCEWVTFERRTPSQTIAIAKRFARCCPEDEQETAIPSITIIETGGSYSTETFKKGRWVTVGPRFQTEKY